MTSLAKFLGKLNFMTRVDTNMMKSQFCPETTKPLQTAGTDVHVLVDTCSQTRHTHAFFLWTLEWNCFSNSNTLNLEQLLNSQMHYDAG